MENQILLPSRPSSPITGTLTPSPPSEFPPQRSYFSPPQLPRRTLSHQHRQHVLSPPLAPRSSFPLLACPQLSHGSPLTIPARRSLVAQLPEKRPSLRPTHNTHNFRWDETASPPSSGENTSPFPPTQYPSLPSINNSASSTPHQAVSPRPPVSSHSLGTSNTLPFTSDIMMCSPRACPASLEKDDQDDSFQSGLTGPDLDVEREVDNIRRRNWNGNTTMGFIRRTLTPPDQRLGSDHTEPSEGRGSSLEPDDLEREMLFEQEAEEDAASNAICIDLTEDPDVSDNRQRAQKLQPLPAFRNPPIVHPCVIIESTTAIDRTNGIEFTIKPGTTVQVSLGSVEDYRFEFVLVSTLYRNLETNTVFLRGMPYTRNRYMRGYIWTRNINEVCEMIRLDDEDDRPVTIQSAVEFPVSEVLHPRYLHHTNAHFPHFRTFVPDDKFQSWYHHDGPLICRWKFVLSYSNAKSREFAIGRHPRKFYLHQLCEDDPRIKPRHRVLDSSRYHYWRSPTIKPGSTADAAINLVDDDNEVDVCDVKDFRPGSHLVEKFKNLPKRENTYYTFGDTFCGAGGASRGAVNAGLKPCLAIDHWSPAARSYALNFPETTLYKMDVRGFIDDRNIPAPPTPQTVDILHLSPPCQTWSPAHTMIGANDDRNHAALFYCPELVSKLRPRIFTMEQTFGILQARHQAYFHTLVGLFTRLGYSVQWGIFDLRNYGVPASRRRLIMFGACPGQKLPPWPEVTHVAPDEVLMHKHESRNCSFSNHPNVNDINSNNSNTKSNNNNDNNNSDVPRPPARVGTKPNLRPFLTVSQACASIRPHHTLQATAPRNFARHQYRRPWDPHRWLTRCITTSGGTANGCNYHWSGKRGLTGREFASLQTFPLTHLFGASYTVVKRLIGNAYPPVAARAFFVAVRRFLEMEDGGGLAVWGDVKDYDGYGEDDGGLGGSDGEGGGGAETIDGVEVVSLVDVPSSPESEGMDLWGQWDDEEYDGVEEKGDVVMVDSDDDGDIVMGGVGTWEDPFDLS